MSWKGTTDRFPRAETDVAKVTILLDNRAGEGLLAEHGLAMWIEAGGMRVLFDTGQGALDFNARVLGVVPGTADALALSHGHYDHTGGVPVVLSRGRGRQGLRPSRDHEAPLCDPRGGGEGDRDAAEAAAALDKHPREHLHWVRGPVMLSGRIGLTGPIPRTTDFEDTGGAVFSSTRGGKPRIPSRDDLALWLRTDDGLVVCAGCAHAGIVNTLEYVRGLAETCGFGPSSAGCTWSRQTVDEWTGPSTPCGEWNRASSFPAYCTGEKAVAALKEAFGERVSPGAAGMTFRFGPG